MPTTRFDDAAPAEDDRPSDPGSPPGRLAVGDRFGARLFVGLAIVVAVAGGLVLAIFVVGADDSAPTLAPLEPGREPAVETAPLPDSVVGLPQTVYAGLRVAVLDTRIAPSAEAGPDLAVVDLVARNEGDRPRRLAASAVDLVAPDGTEVGAIRFDFTPSKDHLLVGPGASVRTLAVFQLPLRFSTDLSSFRLRVADSGRIPADIALDGSEVETPPTEVLDGLPPFPRARGPVTLGDLRVRLLSAISDIEAGSYRAPEGRRVVTMTFLVSNDLAGDVVELDRRSAWRLIATDDPTTVATVPTTALRVSVDEDRLVRQATVTVVFTYPTEATDLLVLADADGTPTPVVRFERPDVG